MYYEVFYIERNQELTSPSCNGSAGRGPTALILGDCKTRSWEVAFTSYVVVPSSVIWTVKTPDEADVRDDKLNDTLKFSREGEAILCFWNLNVNSSISWI